MLAAADDGKVRLYDFAAGESIGFTATDRGAAPAVPRTAQPAANDADKQHGEGASAVDDDVRFTVYRPKSLSPGVWATLLAFAHKTTLLEQPGRPPVDPNKQVAQRAHARFGDTAAPPAGADFRYELARGVRLRIVPELPGIQCNPAEATVDWWEPVHEVEFRILAPRRLAGSVIRGPVRIWCGPLILAEVSLAVPVTADDQVAAGLSVADSAPRYRKIFPSYSGRDRSLLDSFTEAARALGDTYLQDVLALRSGERWEPRLLELIEEADVFQLFWSTNSMRSRYCRDEWEHALSLRRPSFIRPVYWEQPLPRDPALGLPPPGLRELHFEKVRLYAPRPTDEDTGPATVAQQYGATQASQVPEALAPEAAAAAGPPSSPAWGAPPAPPAPLAVDRRDPAGTRDPVGDRGPDGPFRPAGSPARSARSRSGVTLVAALVLVLAVISVLVALHVLP